jgi:hypothetical protein
MVHNRSHHIHLRAILMLSSYLHLGLLNDLRLLNENSVCISHLLMHATFFFPWLYSPCRTLAASHIAVAAAEQFRQMVGLLGRVISPSQGLYLHRTTQHRKTQRNIHALSRIRTLDPSNQPAKTHTSDRTATVIGMHATYPVQFILLDLIILVISEEKILLSLCNFLQPPVTSKYPN